MKRRVEKRYTTGGFAKHFGIRKDTLFYYDKIKLFCPAGVETNGYRYYTSSQIGKFRTLLSLREVGVPVKVLQEYFQEPSPEFLREITTGQIQKINEEMKKLRKIKRLLGDISAATTEALQAVTGEVKIQNLPDQKIIYSRENTRRADTSDQDWKDIYEDFVQDNRIAGTAYVGSVISQADLKKGQFGYVYKLFTASLDGKGMVRKGGLYAVCYHKGRYDSIPEIYPKILYEIKQQGYEAAGDAYEEYLIAETATDCEEDYITKIIIKVSYGIPLAEPQKMP